MATPIYEVPDDFTDGFGNDFSEPPPGFGIEPTEDFCTCDGPYCLGCGCCAHRACPGGCVWATPTLCSRCL